MSARSTLLAALGTLTATFAVAKPPDLPMQPLIEGREPSPIAREFYETEVPRSGGFVTPATAREQVNPLPLSGFVTGIHRVMLNRATVPLGTVPVR